MTLQKFITDFNLLDAEVKGISYKNKEIHLILAWNIEIKYIANGCRPEFNEVIYHEFIFPNQDECKNSKFTENIKNYKYVDQILYIRLANYVLKIKECDVRIIPNVYIDNFDF